MEKLIKQLEVKAKDKTLEELQKENKYIENLKLLKELNSKKIWSVILSILTLIIIPVIFYIYTQYAAEKERIIKEKEVNFKDIEVQIKLMSFFLENYDKVFSEDTIVVHNISQVFAVFPTQYTRELFIKIKELSTEQNKKIWQEKEDIATKVESTKAEISFFSNDMILKKKLEKNGYLINPHISAYNNINTIWCSDDISIEIIKEVANLLIEN